VQHFVWTFFTFTIITVTFSRPLADDHGATFACSSD
jgi:hypothetical protein